jgi:hypothetical protein
MGRSRNVCTVVKNSQWCEVLAGRNFLNYNFANVRRTSIERAFQEAGGNMKDPRVLFTATFLSLGILAVAMAPRAYLRGDLIGGFTLLIAAVLFFNRWQGKRS